MAKSGYAAIHENFMKLDEIGEFVALFFERVKTTKIVDYGFSVNSSSEDGVNHNLICQFGEFEEDTLPSEIAPWKISVGPDAVPVEELRAIRGFTKELFDKVWNTYQCKTYFCLKSKAWDGGDKGGDTDAYIEDSIRSIICSDKYKEARIAVRIQVKAQVREVMDSSEFKEARELFAVNSSKDAIIAAMRRFPNIADDVFQEALEEFLAERVIED